MSYFEMSRLALKWAVRKPVTSRYPFEPRLLVPASRGKLLFDAEHCVHCTLCAKKCPTGALRVNRARKQWAIDRLLCIGCGACVEACPKDALSFSAEHLAPTITKDREFH